MVSYIKAIYRRIATFPEKILWSWTPYKSEKPSKEKKKPLKERRLRNAIPIII